MAHGNSIASPNTPLRETMQTYLQPARSTTAREMGQIPFDSISRSYFLMRLLVGCLGLALPIVLLLGDLFFMGANFSARGSLSAYYHSGMRDVFVGILAVVGMLLMTYKITERNRDNLLSLLAGIAALGVAIFPTGIPSGVDVAQTPLQDRIGESTTSAIHYGCAAVFIACLGLLCRDFAKRERARLQQRVDGRARHSPEFWYRFHLWMARIIAIAAAFIVVTQATGVFDRHSIFIGEVAVTAAFGLSWLLKGMERAVLPKMDAATPPTPDRELDAAA